MNGNKHHTMNATTFISLRWIYRELIKNIEILEVLSDAAVFCKSYHANFIICYSHNNSRECKRKCVTSITIYQIKNRKPNEDIKRF